MNVGAVFDARVRAIEDLKVALSKIQVGAARAKRPSWESEGGEAYEFRDALVASMRVDWILMMTDSLSKAVSRCGPLVQRGEMDEDLLLALEHGVAESIETLQSRLNALDTARSEAEEQDAATADLRLLNLIRSKIGPIDARHKGRTFDTITVVEDDDDPTCEPPSACFVAGSILLGGAPRELAHAVLHAPQKEDRADVANFHACWTWLASLLFEKTDECSAPFERASWALAGGLLTAAVRDGAPRYARCVGLSEACSELIEYADLPPEVNEILHDAALPFAPEPLSVVAKRGVLLWERLESVCLNGETTGRRGGRPVSSNARWRQLGRLIQRSHIARTAPDWKARANAHTPPILIGNVYRALKSVIASGEFNITKVKIGRPFFFGTPNAIDRVRR